jgi:hypothetical protein
MGKHGGRGSNLNRRVVGFTFHFLTKNGLKSLSLRGFNDCPTPKGRNAGRQKLLLDII